MKKKLRIGVLFGGRSGEHEVSLLSAASILKAIDRTKYEVVPIGITRQGQWLNAADTQHLLAGNGADSPKTKSTKKSAKKSSSKAIQRNASAELAQQSGSLSQTLDIIFPVLH